MDRLLDPAVGAGYHSRSQIARVVTQRWVEDQLECLSCPAPRLSPTRQNTPSRDFTCENCAEPYELKSSSRPFGRWVVDGQYDTMMETIRTARTPNLLLMEYDRDLFQVRNLVGIHRQGLSPLAISQRLPLGPGARRAGWRGCNIDLGAIPTAGRVALISAGIARPWADLRRDWARLQFMVALRPDSQGWMRDVLACVQRVQPSEFRLEEMYRFERELGRLHPANQNIRPKIRQQLQILVARGILRRVGPGIYLRNP